MSVEIVKRYDGFVPVCDSCGDLGGGVAERSTANHLRLCHYDWHRARDETWAEGHARWARGYDTGRRVDG